MTPNQAFPMRACARHCAIALVVLISNKVWCQLGVTALFRCYLARGTVLHRWWPPSFPQCRFAFAGGDRRYYDGLGGPGLSDKLTANPRCDSVESAPDGDINW